MARDQEEGSGQVAGGKPVLYPNPGLRPPLPSGFITPHFSRFSPQTLSPAGSRSSAHSWLLVPARCGSTQRALVTTLSHRVVHTVGRTVAVVRSKFVMPQPSCCVSHYDTLFTLKSCPCDELQVNAMGVARRSSVCVTRQDWGNMLSVFEWEHLGT